MKKKAFEHTLPEGYSPIMVVDAKSKKTVIVLNVVSIAIMAAVAVIAYFTIRPKHFLENISLIRTIIFFLVLFAYIVLHELLHGIAYKTLTHEKLTFGLTLSVAYCGVPNIFVYRRTALIALLAPFIVFTIIFGAMIFVFSDPWDKMYATIVFGIHLGGCSGDLYNTFLYITKLRDPSILMQDTGPKQIFYKKF